MRSITSLLRRSRDADPLETIKRAQYEVLIVPFLDSPVPVVVRELTQAQIMACGSFSLIETFKDKIERQQKSGGLDLQSVLEFSEKHHEICRRALVKPTYDQIIEELTDSTIDEMKELLAGLRERLKETPAGPEREKLENEIDAMSVWTDYLLPDDFTGTIVAYALGVEKSDIKEISRETLLQAAVLAQRGHNNPADHLEGRFTAYMRDDINQRAWIIFEEERDKRKANK